MPKQHKCPKCKSTNIFAPRDQRYCNYSAFSGYHRTASDYSQVYCPDCLHLWRSKAPYISALPESETEAKRRTEEAAP